MMKRRKIKPKTKELVTFTFLVILVLYISMGHMLKFPVSNILNINMHPINYAPTLLALTIPFLIYEFDIFKSGFKNLTHKSPNMDTLVSIGALSSLTYGLVPRRKNLPASENLIRLLTRRFNKY